MSTYLPFVRSAFNYDTMEASDESSLKCLDKSLAHQSFAEETDINNIVAKFLKTGVAPESIRVPTFQDFEGIFDFQSAMQTMMQAEEAFMAMPGDVRARFNHDPAAFVGFCSDPANMAEAAALGLAVKRPEVVLTAPPEAA